jgi:signal peptidase I
VDLRELKEFFSDTIKYILITIGIIIIVIYIVGLQQVVGPSMKPTLNNGNILLLNKFIYHFKEPKRNDIIAFSYEDTKFLIKRVIGLPGENVEYNNNVLYINGEPFMEKIVDDMVTEDFALKEMGYDTIPKDMYLVLGDNRGDSLDSRSFGLLSKKDIIGKPFLRIWPINEFKIIK